MRQREERMFDVRTAAALDGETPTRIEGYAAVFNQIANDEVIAPGAFTKTLQEQRDIKFYWGHNSNIVLGRTGNGTLELREDAQGLFFAGTPNPGTSWGRDALASVFREDVTQMSFAFSPIKESIEQLDGRQVRILKEVRLYEVSLVAEPWYPGTKAEAKEKANNEPEPIQADHSTRKRLIRLRVTRKEFDHGSAH